MSVQPVFSEASFRQTLSRADASTLFVIDFYAEWCGPCQALAPKLESLAKKYKDNANFLKVDVDKLSQISGKYGVSAMPTIVFIKNNKTLDTVVGADLAAIQRNIDRYYELKTKAFSGTGYKLGASTSDVSKVPSRAAPEEPPSTVRSRLATRKVETPIVAVPAENPGSRKAGSIASDEVELQIKFADQRVLRHVFKTSQTLQEVHHWVEKHSAEAAHEDNSESSTLPPPKNRQVNLRSSSDLLYRTWSEYFCSFVPEFVSTCGVAVWRAILRLSPCPKNGLGKFYLTTSFPKKSYKTKEDLSKALKDEGLVFRAQLHVIEA